MLFENETLSHFPNAILLLYIPDLLLPRLLEEKGRLISFPSRVSRPFGYFTSGSFFPKGAPYPRPFFGEDSWTFAHLSLLE